MSILLAIIIYHGRFTRVSDGKEQAMAMRLGQVQHRIMRVLWDRRHANARDITAALAAHKPIAHSTVQTLLRKLEDKGAVRHTIMDRTFVYHPAVDEHSVTRSTTRDLIERVFAGSAAGLVAYLLREERISKLEIEELRQLIDKRTSNKGGDHGTR